MIVLLSNMGEMVSVVFISVSFLFLFRGYSKFKKLLNYLDFFTTWGYNGKNKYNFIWDSKGFDRGFKAGEASRRRCVNSQN